MEQVGGYNGNRERATNHILIVDDDTETCDLLALTFQRTGYRTTTATDGQEALRLVDEVKPDLVILDIMMPGIDGWETFEGLRGISDIPVLFLTALNSGKHAARALELGETDYLRKPYFTPELLGRTETLLNRARPQLSPSRRDTSASPSLPVRPSIVAVIPAYNEERFIGSVVLKARKYARTVIVIDDGSTDATAQVARDAGAVVLSHPVNQGKGAALNTAFHSLRDRQPQVVVMLDGDGQHSPEELAQVVEPVLDGEADIVVGSRYLEQKSEVPRHRILGHWVFNWITRVLAGVPSSDSQSGYRAFSPKAIEAISFQSNGFSVESEMQFLARECELRLVEIPITIRYEDPPKRSVIAHGLGVLNGILRLVGQYRPLLFFGVPGLGLMIGGLTWGAWMLQVYLRTGQLITPSFIPLSALLAVIGLIMLSTGLILHSVRGLLLNILGPVGRQGSLMDIRQRKSFR